jgi:UDP-3-O-[3-hydroxymyristoyl] glucosamine N-acyltransferase
MLINYDPISTLFIIGTEVYAHELATMISAETTGKIKCISKEQFLTLPANSQCMLGFKNIDYRIDFLKNKLISQHKWPGHVHPTAVIVDHQPAWKPGIIIGPLSMVGHQAVLGEFCNIGPMCVVGHGCHLGNNTVASNSIHIGGSTNIGKNVFLGQMCSIKTKIIIVDDCVIGMNGVVTKNITVPGYYVGSPVRPTQKLP